MTCPLLGSVDTRPLSPNLSTTSWFYEVNALYFSEKNAQSMDQYHLVSISQVKILVPPNLFHYELKLQYELKF
jgi:hypothetical protein